MLSIQEFNKCINLIDTDFYKADYIKNICFDIINNYQNYKLKRSENDLYLIERYTNIIITDDYYSMIEPLKFGGYIDLFNEISDYFLFNITT